ncbi:hypothetical protein SUNI508_02627 [Seiridium unicorne]|uniref:Uncharacterized protein n=1 Tax=Seiridium unicorne TaxID=138068 RepID=A0ABR2UG14_9PEZI
MASSRTQFVNEMHRIRQDVELRGLKPGFPDGFMKVFRDLIDIIPTRDNGTTMSLHEFRSDFLAELCRHFRKADVGPYAVGDLNPEDDEAHGELHWITFAWAAEDARRSVGDIIELICTNWADSTALITYPEAFKRIHENLVWEGRASMLQPVFIDKLRRLLENPQHTAETKSMRWFRFRLYALVYNDLWPENAYPDDYNPTDTKRVRYERRIKRKMLQNAVANNLDYAKEQARFRRARSNAPSPQSVPAPEPTCATEHPDSQSSRLVPNLISAGKQYKHEDCSVLTPEEEERESQANRKRKREDEADERRKNRAVKRSMNAATEDVEALSFGQE